MCLATLKDMSLYSLLLCLGKKMKITHVNMKILTFINQIMNLFTQQDKSTCICLDDISAWTYSSNNFYDNNDNNNNYNTKSFSPVAILFLNIYHRRRVHGVIKGRPYSACMHVVYWACCRKELSDPLWVLKNMSFLNSNCQTALILIISQFQGVIFKYSAENDLTSWRWSGWHLRRWSTSKGLNTNLT